LLDATEQKVQLELLAESVDNELARLEALYAHHVTDGSHLVEWLDREIEDLERRRDWLKAKSERV